MTMTSWPSGVLTALLTPLRDDTIDVDGLQSLIDHQAMSGACGVVVGGGTGEYGTLDLDERRLLAKESVAAASGRIPVVVQTGTLATRDAVALSEHAEQIGASALMVASPFGEPLTWTERLHFYATLTAQAGIPVMIYNTPPSGLLTFAQIQELAQLPNVSAVKDSSGNPELMGDLIAWAGPDFGVYVGLDSLMYDAIAGGARGVVFGTANLIPGILSAIARSVREHGPTSESRALWLEHVRPLLRVLEQSTNYIAVVKAVAAAQGLPVGTVRPPYLEPQRDEVDGVLRHIDGLVAAFAESSLPSAAPAAAVG
jgi:4-hydroxy-tetrahydrodipicolinate synthase